MPLRRSVFLAVLFLSTTALAQAPHDPDAAKDSLSDLSPDDANAQADRLEEQSRRSDLTAEGARARATGLRTVATLARKNLDSLRAPDRADGERGLRYLDEELAQLSATEKTATAASAEFRAQADSLRAAARRSMANAPSCSPPFVIDANGRKRWKPQCF